MTFGSKMNSGPRGLRGLALLAAVGAGLAACGKVEESDRSGDPLPASGARPLQHFYDYRLIETESGVRQWVLVSDEMLKFGGQEDVLLVTVHMDFFREGEHFSVLTADSGRANLHTRDIHAWGNVIVVTDDDRRLETEQLYFDNETELIHNDVFNRFTREDDVLTGIGLEAPPDLEYIEIKQEVEAEVVDDTEQDATRKSGGR